MCQFTHLHNHSDGSTPISGDGLGTVENLVKAAKAKGFEALALTDHGSLLNTPSFIHAANYHGIKPISGLEGYVEENGETFHLTILADGNEGFNSLTQLNNIAQNNYKHNRPNFKLTDLAKWNQGLIVLTGCISSPLQELDYSDAKQIGLFLKGVFGSRLFAEMMFVGLDQHIERAIKLAEDLKLKIVVTNDCHFPNEGDSKAHSVLTSMHKGYDYPSDYLFLANLSQLEARVNAIAPNHKAYLEIGAKNAYLIGKKIKPVIFDNKLSLPIIKDVDFILYNLIEDGIKKRGFVGNSEVFQRVNYEFKIISEMGFSSYFYILNDMVNYARSIGVKVGAGRGSGAGSLILYCLGITDINPLEFDLKFERFINPKRLDFPDVDIDYDSKGRNAVIEYAKQRWAGIPIATYSRYSPKSLINDLAKYFQISREDTENVKNFGFDDNDNPTKVYEDFVKDKPDFDECYSKIVNQIRHIGKHAGGIIITDKVVPMIKTANKNNPQLVASWTEGLHAKEFSSMGIVKFDILGISSLDVLAALEAKHGVAPYPTDDSPVFDLFCNGDTLGIFQFAGSDGIVEFTKRIKPRKFIDLVAINALWRPGAMQGAAPHYQQFKENGQRKLHPLIDPILAETYGVICYQEQFMSIYAAVTDGDLGDADIARKILVKGQGKQNDPEWKAKLTELESKFLDGCQNKAIPKKTANLIWKEIQSHSGYSFNKSHAVAYTMLSWQLAWLKYHFRADFYAASLSVDEEKSQDYLFDVIKAGIEVVSPDINTSTDEYVSDGKRIYMPLTAIKGISDAAYDAILIQKPYTSYMDFINKVPKKKVNKRGKKALFALGAFKDFTDDFKVLDIDEIQQKTLSEIQAEYLGFALPTQEFFKAVAKAQTKGLIAGVITKIEEKETKIRHRKYVRYHLYPSTRPVRSYRVLDLPIGKQVQFKVNTNDYGHEMISVTELEYE